MAASARKTPLACGSIMASFRFLSFKPRNAMNLFPTRNDLSVPWINASGVCVLCVFGDQFSTRTKLTYQIANRKLNERLGGN